MYFCFRRSRVAIAVITGATVIGVGAAAAVATSSAPAGGSFRVFDVGSGQGSGGSVLLTGAIGDHGRSRSVNKGHDVKLTLSKGTLTLNKTNIDKALTKAFRHAKLNKATCSTSVAASGTLPIVKGSGRYAGASGSAHLTIAIGFILPRKAGKCNTSMHAKPVASRTIVYGAGKVSF